MRIEVQRSGGFANINQSSRLSTDEMPEEQAQQLTDLVKESRFFELPSEIRSSRPGADRFQYKIKVENEQGGHTVQVDEGAVPPSLQPLLNWVKNSTSQREGK
jgi:hypothetical protein